ncbi:N-acetylglucosamine-6-phosphate deacetylase [Luteolibacter sp. SL250]|uniref:N-acetylglucosamine-6-phosphate deacetylase n=1 Tax=Luteolibacter sp. SL250 TaxID=2995170 RepID=UPI00226E3C88|nr:N-acetylglucosamine-6-phosphate deacetylase [Luteolibacter sp. SL250]WAC21405.1 N-acetylglucosamine-6-phosphate deacetylase [Luteolibacter sp. SL250]
MKTLIRHAHLVSPGWEREGALLVEGGRIVSVHAAGETVDADEIFDAGGRIIMPGFIDIHSHGAEGADVCDGEAEAVRHIARTKLREGVTTWLPTTLTQPADRLKDILGACALVMGEGGLCRMPGIHLEGPFINAAKAGAQNPEYVRPPDEAELRALHAIAPLRILSLAPEMPGALDLIRVARSLGITCSAAHTAATCREIMEAKSCGLSHLTHFGNAMTPLHHREIGVVGAGLLDDALMLELICDGVHLSTDMLSLMFHRVSIDRLMLITDSVAASWMPDGRMRLGGLDAEIRDQVVRLGDGTLAGSTLKFNDGVARVRDLTGLPLAEISRMTSWNQARSLGLEGLGKLERGFHADLVMLERDFSVSGVWVAGQRR